MSKINHDKINMLHKHNNFMTG